MNWLWAALAVGAGMLSLSAAGRPDPGGRGEARVGFAEEFDGFEGWQPSPRWPHGDPFGSVEVKDGVVTVKTHCGALDYRTVREDWPEWPKQPYADFVTVSRTYDQPVDLDRFHYVVLTLPLKGTFVEMSVNGIGTKVAYTAGTHAQDLAPLGLKGTQQVRLSFNFLNTSGSVAFDSVKLVSELTPEEQAGFIPEGLEVPAEGLEGHPYHRLEALNRRADGPTVTGSTEWVVFRDVGTGAVLWKMTNMPSDENNTSFNGDGSAFFITGRQPNGLDIFRFATRTYEHWQEGLTNPEPAFSPADPNKLLYWGVEWLRQKSRGHRRHMAILRDIVTGEAKEIASFETEGPWVVNELSTPADSPKMAFGQRETNIVFLLDPTETDPAKQARQILLPTRLKGLSLLRRGTLLEWFNCYTYQSWHMNLETGKVELAHRPDAGGHAAAGEYSIVGPYGGSMKILFPRDLEPLDASTAGRIKIFGNYKKPLRTDYGGLTADEKWVRTNGVGEDVRDQHLLISVDDPGTVLHVTCYNTSRNNWATNTYSAASPDCTKLAFVSDQLGNGDVYFAVTRLPDPPRDLTVTGKGGTNVLSWEPPARGREVKEYAVYRSKDGGRGYRLLATSRETTFTDTGAPAGASYLVAAREHSGLEGHFSNEASTSASGRHRLHFEGELGALALPMRQVFDGGCSGYGYVRVTPETKEEVLGAVTWLLPDLASGPWWVWGRVKARDVSGTFAVKAGTAEATLAVDGKDWRWTKSGKLASLKGAGQLSLSSATPGLCIDKVILTDDPGYRPKTLDDRVTTPPSAPAKLRVTATTLTRIDLTWDADSTGGVAYYSVYVGEGKGFQPANETVLCSTVESKASDVGLSPGTQYTYTVVAYDWRGNASPAATVSAKTAPAEPVRVTLAAEQATLDTALATAEKASRSVVLLPAAPEGEPADTTPRWATYTFTVPEGEYMLWASYAPGNTDKLGVQLELDGKPLGTWTLRAPYRPMSRALTSGEAPRLWFADKVRWGLTDDVLRLAAGEHTLRVAFDPSLKQEGHWLETLSLTNDFSFRPEGWDPRVDFAKLRRP